MKLGQYSFLTLKSFIKTQYSNDKMIIDTYADFLVLYYMQMKNFYRYS